MTLFATTRSTPVLLPDRLGAVLSDRAEWLLAAVVALQAATALALHLVYPELGHPHALWMLGKTAVLLAVLVPFSVLLLAFRRILVRPPEGSAILALFTQMADYVRDRDRLANGLPVMALLVPFTVLFVHLKVAIPAILPFAYDRTFSALDRSLFLGHLPHEWLGPIVANPAALLATNIAYNLWFFAVWCSLVACAFGKERTELRSRYLLASFLVWFVEGNVLALLLSSAGPCFFGPLGLSPDPYAELMSRLREANEIIPLWSLETQRALWSGHLGETEAAGISAMPSLHNATSVLMALAARHYGRGPALAFAAYALWIFVGSIVLAWHYAVDGLAAALVTIGLWWLAGRLVRPWHHPPTGGR